MRVLVDTNIVIDVLQHREPWFEAGEELFIYIAKDCVSACLTAKQITDIYYISCLQLKGRDNKDKIARQIIGSLMSFFDVVDTSAEDCREAFGIDNGDYEDAVIISAARRESVDAIVTRDACDFAGFGIPVYSAAEFTKLLG